ncbi:MAG: aspartyl protease family protein [Myxococcota bacterium]
MLTALFACAPAPEPEPWSMAVVHSVVPWVQDSTGHWLLLDTGTPRTQVRPDVVGGRTGFRSPPGWTVGRFDPDEVLVSDDLPQPMLEAEARGDIVGLGGIVGADQLLTRSWWLDPRASTLWVDQDPPGVRSVTEVPVAPEGVGRSCFSDVPCFDYEGARILVDVAIGGETLTLLLDTGATYVMLEPAAMDRLGLSVHDWDFGDMIVPIAAARVRLGDAVAEDVAVMVTPEDFAESLIGLELEVDRHVDGVLGHSFLRRYVLGLDAPGGTLSLGAYTAGSWDWRTHWVTPGFGVDDGDADCFTVRFVVDGSPAADAGLGPGDCVGAVDELRPQDVSADEVMAYLADLGAGAEVSVDWAGDDWTLENENWAR